MTWSPEISRHKCPRRGCEKLVPPDRLACPDHWFRVSLPTRTRVWTAWREREKDPDAHAAAVRDAVREMNR